MVGWLRVHVSARQPPRRVCIRYVGADTGDRTTIIRSVRCVFPLCRYFRNKGWIRSGEGKETHGWDLARFEGGEKWWKARGI